MEENNYLEIAIEIKKWTENNEEKLPPSKKSKDEVEKKLAKDLKFLKKKLIKPYKKLKNEKAIEEFEQKYPDIKSICEIIEKIEANEQYDIKMDEHKIELENELEKNIKDETIDFEYDKSNTSQSNLADLIVKDIKIRKSIEEANKLKEKYKKK